MNESKLVRRDNPVGQRRGRWRGNALDSNKKNDKDSPKKNEYPKGKAHLRGDVQAVGNISKKEGKATGHEFLNTNITLGVDGV